MTVSTAIVLAPQGGVLGTALADITTPVPAGTVQRLEVRFANIGAADAFADLFVVDTNGVVVSHYRAKNFPVPFQQIGSAPDMEQGLVLPAGLKLQGRGSAASAVGYSVTGIQDQA